MEELERTQIVRRRIGQRGDLGFTQIDTDGEIVDGAAGAELAELGGKSLGADVGKAQAVHQSLLRRIAEHPRLLVSRLRVVGDGAELGKAEAEILPGQGNLAVFVHPGGDAEAVAECEAHQGDFIPGRGRAGDEEAG